LLPSINHSGQRVLAVAAGNEQQLHLVGLLGLEDTVRDDSKTAVDAIHDAGVRVVMVTGDNELTARRVAEQVDIPPEVCPTEKLRGDLRGDALENSVFAGVFPEQKFKPVRAFQRCGEIVAMTGDGVNDAPALRQAEAGVALANATDVSKAAAAIVLTHPGLSDVVPTIQMSRIVFQRMITYTLNMLAKKLELMVLLAVDFLLTRHRPLTPLMMVLFIFLNDFLTMALSTDRMKFSPKPNRWKTRDIVLASAVIAGCKLGFSLGTFCYGYYLLQFDAHHLQTLTFAAVLLGSQAGVYLLRERRHFWDSRPANLLLTSSAFGLGVAAALTIIGIFMLPISWSQLAVVAVVALLYFMALDWLKIWLFDRLDLR
jgi:H+-transporting ATPase